MNLHPLTPRQKIARGIDGIFRKHSCLASIAAKWTVIESAARTRTFATDGPHLFYNPEFAAQLNLAETEFILLHEAGHVFLGHHLRLIDKDKDCRNTAYDLALNSLLRRYRPHDSELIMKGQWPGEGQWAAIPTDKECEYYWNLLFEGRIPPKPPGPPKPDPDGDEEDEGENEGESNGEGDGDDESEQDGDGGEEGGDGDSEDGDEDGENGGKGKGEGDESGDSDGDGSGEGEGDGGEGDADGDGGAGEGDEGEGTGKGGSQGGNKGKDKGKGKSKKPDGSGKKDKPKDKGEGEQGDQADASDNTLEHGDVKREGKVVTKDGMEVCTEGLWGEVLPHPDLDGGEEEQRVAERNWREQVATAVVLAKAEGAGAGEFVEVFDEMFEESEVDWRSILRRFMSENARCGQTWSRPHRRYIGLGIHLPTRRSKVAGRGLVIVDTSGSMGCRECNLALSEMEQILRQFSHSTVDLIQCDYAVAGDVRTFTQNDFPLEVPVEWMGRGGTDLEPAFKWLVQHRNQYKWCVCVTDMYWHAGAIQDTGVPTIWASTSIAWDELSEYNKPQFGQFFRIGQGE